MFMLKLCSTAKDILEFIPQFYLKGEGDKHNIDSCLQVPEGHKTNS